MASKRGISDVVSTVLIILLVVAAVAVVGAIVLRTINNASKTVQGSVSCQDVQITPIKCSYTNNAANSTVLVSRSNGGASTSVVNLTFIFINSSAGETRTIGANIPNVLETKSYDANNYGGVLSTVTVPSYVAVAATIKGPSGNVLCPASANVKCLNVATLSCTPAVGNVCAGHCGSVANGTCGSVTCPGCGAGSFCNSANICSNCLVGLTVNSVIAPGPAFNVSWNSYAGAANYLVLGRTTPSGSPVNFVNTTETSVIISIPNPQGYQYFSAGAWLC